MPEPAIRVDHVWKKFRKGELHDSLRDLIPAVVRRLLGKGPKSDALQSREFWALNDVSFEVQKGESLGIIGPNGAGKSTMLKLLSRIIGPTRGHYHVNGRVSALIEVGAGFHQDLTGRENIFLNGAILGMTKKEIRAKEEAIIDFAGVEDFIETPVKRYSSGMKARLGFAVAAHLEPDVLLVDEVLSVGDARFRYKCLRHMKSLLQSDVTVVFISHLLDQVRDLCPNTIVLDKGEVVHNGDTSAAIRLYLDLLSADGDNDTNNAGAAAEIKRITFLNSDAKETLEWRARKQASVECDLVVHKPLERLTVVIDFKTASGTYLGTANAARQGFVIPGAVGEYKVRFDMNPMPLADGDYTVEFKLFDMATDHIVWTQRQPRLVTVRGSGIIGAHLTCDGAWTVAPVEVDSATPSDLVSGTVGNG